MREAYAVRRALILSISLAAFISSSATGAGGRSVPAPRQRPPIAALKRPGGAGGPLSAQSNATYRAHAALRQSMLRQIRPPAFAAPAPIRSAANVRALNRAGPGGSGGHRGAYHPMPGHGALGGPTIIRAATKGLSGVRQLP